MPFKETYLGSSEVTKEDIKLLDDVKKAVGKDSDALVKRDREGRLRVYKNKITKVS